MNPTQKSSGIFLCKTCDYTTCRKSQYTRHLETEKHKSLQNPTSEKFQTEKVYECNCGKIYKHSSTLYAHKKTCIQEKEKEEEEPTDKQLMCMLIKQNSELIKEHSVLIKEHADIKELILEIVKNGVANTSINNSQTTITHTNSHNKAFNLNFFLNETCKNAMNITDFVDSIKLQLSDLIEVGEVGYVEGISKIIVKNLNNLQETERPIHCTDKKRETMYIKDEGQWNKEDEQKTKLKKMITKIADKNIRLLPQFREKYPEYKNSSSKVSDKYDKMVIEAMTTDDLKNDKIVKNISKITTITENH